jgi:hypothetical protein
MNKRVRAGIIGAAVTIAMAAALKDNAVAFALGVAALVAFGGLSSGRCGERRD